MRIKTFTLLVSSLLTTSAFAQAPAFQSLSAKAITPQAQPLAVAANAPEQDGAGIIAKTPDDVASSTMYYRSAAAYYYSTSTGSVTTAEINGSATSMSVSADGATVYMKNPLSTLVTNSYIKGTVGEDTYTFTLPQPIYESVLSDGTKQVTYLNVMDYDAEQKTYVVTSGTNALTFALEDGVYVAQGMEDGLQMIGVTDADGNWIGNGEFWIHLAELTDVANTAPEDAEWHGYRIYNERGSNKNIEGAVKDGTIYLRSLPDIDSSFVVKGTIADGIVTFADNQYLGADSRARHVYFMGHYTELVNWSYTYTLTHEPLIMVYNEETGVMSEPDGDLYFNMGNQNYHRISYTQTPTIEPWEETPETPQEPEISEFLEYSESRGYGLVLFTISNYSKSGAFMNTDKLFYNVYYDNQIHTFEPNEADGRTEAMTDVPYKYSSLNDFLGYGGDFYLYFREGNFGMFGLQTVYYGGGEENRSDIVWRVNNAELTAINGVNVTENVNVTYTDLSGRQVSQPSKGIYIMTATKADGSKTSKKVVLK